MGRAQRPIFYARRLPTPDAAPVHRLHRAVRRRDGGDHAHDPLGGVHALRHERSAAVARARLGDHDGVLFIRGGRRGLSRQPADRSRSADARGRPAQPRGDAVGRACLHAADRHVHAGLRRASVLAHARQHHRRIPVAVGRHRLPADPARRPADAAVHHREDLARRAAAGRPHVQRPGRGSRIVDILVLLGSFAALCALGVPVAYALGLSALVAAFYVDIPLEAVMIKISDGTDDFVLLAIPFFVLAGGIMAEGGMATRLVMLAKIFFGVIRGGLALVNILASTLFGAVSGSSVADTASIGSVMIPQMVKQGYPRVFATNVTICGSVQALLIPPSHNAVIYSVAAGGTISVAHLFLAGVFPGLLFGLCLVGLVLWTARKRNMPKSEPIPLKDIPRIVLEALWGLVTVVIIIGGILSGVFTPTESAAVACVYAFLVTFLVYRDYKWRDLPHLVHRVVKTVAMVMLLIGFSVAFGYMMAIMQIPAKITAFFLGISENKYVFLLLVNILLLLLGTFMDLAPMLLICTPIFLPVIAKLGIDPVHFGMIMILNLGIGLITPPVGPTLFVGCAIGKVTIEQVTKELWPFYGAMCIALLLVTYIPAISLWLPGLMK